MRLFKQCVDLGPLALGQIQAFQHALGYFTLQPQQTANKDVRLQKGQMPNLFIVTKGRGVGYLGDGKIDLKPGMSIFVPPFVRHEITAVGDEPMEGVVVLYGDNSDFAFGTSYPAFLQDLYEFYGGYPFREEVDAEHGNH